MRKMIVAQFRALCLAVGLLLMLTSATRAATPAIYLTSPQPAIQWQQSFGGSDFDFLLLPSPQYRLQSVHQKRSISSLYRA